jgi:hypothetical protein
MSRSMLRPMYIGPWSATAWRMGARTAAHRSNILRDPAWFVGDLWSGTENRTPAYLTLKPGFHGGAKNWSAWILPAAYQGPLSDTAAELRI